jgi:RNA polymerase sigma factor (sigma-70 family)
MPVARSHRGSAVAATAADEARPDAVLAAEAAAGSTSAFEQLYRRHAEAAWRVASAVCSNRDDAADAVSDAFTRVLAALASDRLEDGALFRSYLLTATRNAAIDLHRRAHRTQPLSLIESGDGLDRLDVPTTAPTVGERIDDSHDAALVAEAFRGLPERWRSVLWLTEVEGIPAREAAALLGVTANNVSQLAVRARAGLRERFVQAHLRKPVNADCRFCVDRLGGYVTGNLSPRELAKVDQHLAGCETCRDKAAELEDLGTSLRRILLPLPLLLGPAAMSKFKLASAATAPASAAAATSSAATGTLSWSASAAAKAQKPLLAASTGIAALGIISASVIGNPMGGPVAAGRRSPVAAVAAPPPQVVEDHFVTLVASRPGGALGTGAGAGASAGGGSARGGAPGGGRAAVPPTNRGPATGGPGFGQAPRTPGSPPPSNPTQPPTATPDSTSKPPSAEPLVNAAAGAKVGASALAASIGSGDGSCTGAAAGPVSAGCKSAPPAGNTAAVAVSTDGSAGGGILRNRTITAGS